MTPLYVYDPRHAWGSPTTTWGRRPAGRVVAYARPTPDGWRVRDLRTNTDRPVAGRIEATQRITAIAESDPALTLGGVR